MAIAEGKSSMRTGELSLHCTTMIDLLKIFSEDIKIKVTQEPDTKTNLIEIEGLALK